MTLIQVIGGTVLTAGVTLLTLWLTLRYSRQQQLDDQRANRERIYEALDRQTAQRDAEALRVWHATIRDEASRVRVWLIINGAGLPVMPDDRVEGSAIELVDNVERVVHLLNRSRNPPIGSAEHHVSAQATALASSSFNAVLKSPQNQYPHVVALGQALSNLELSLGQEVARLDRKATGREPHGSSELNVG